METITFRPLRREDFALLGRWLTEPLVRRWWNHDPSPEAIERDFGPAVDGTDPGEVCLALLDGRPFGLVQRYVIADTPAYLEELATVVAVPPGALSVDYLIGEPALRGRGLGARTVAAFVEEAWARYPDAAEVLVPVSAANEGSWRTLERAGLVRVAEGELEPDNPVDDRRHVLYAIRRPVTTRRAPGRRPGDHHPDRGSSEMGEKSEDLGGRVKEATGTLTGDDELKNEGKVDQASASVKDKIGDAADGIKGIVGKGDKDK